MMKFKTFIRKSLIENYLVQNYPHRDMLYSLWVVKKRWFLLTQYTFLIYSQEDIVTTIENIINDIVQKSFNIKIFKFDCNFNHFGQQQIIVNLSTQNDNLLVGKFGQNKQSLQNLIAKALFHTFKNKYEITLHFAKRTIKKITPNFKKTTQPVTAETDNNA